jgi:hypothetical protein
MKMRLVIKMTRPGNQSDSFLKLILKNKLRRKNLFMSVFSSGMGQHAIDRIHTFAL